jgi:RimJ/RimL family protein N-acetyltransferase
MGGGSEEKIVLTMPELTTERLRIRPFRSDDFEVTYRIIVLDFDPNRPGDIDEVAARKSHRDWLEWSIANERMLARMNQPPYGDRAVERLDDGVVVGSVGLVPSFAPFGLLPNFPESDLPASAFMPQVGMFWALGRDQRGRGYATEAARAVIDYAFDTLQLGRIVATTEHDNATSIGVMQRLGMAIERNPHPDPAWFQVCGVLDNRR